jgi:hypothetical protein
MIRSNFLSGLPHQLKKEAYEINKKLDERTGIRIETNLINLKLNQKSDFKNLCF